MRLILIAGGILLILLAVLLAIAAIVVFLLARKRAATAAGASDATHPAAKPAESVAAIAVPIPQPQSHGAMKCVAGALAGRTFPIDAGGFYIGRDRTLAQVIVDSPSVSKRHVWIGPRDGAVVAIDQNSTNGTYLNDPAAAMTEARLSPGDTLILADDVARFRYEA
jgi:hypothetical protein